MRRLICGYPVDLTDAIGVVRDPSGSVHVALRGGGMLQIPTAPEFQEQAYYDALLAIAELIEHRAACDAGGIKN